MSYTAIAVAGFAQGRPLSPKETVYVRGWGSTLTVPPAGGGAMTPPPVSEVLMEVSQLILTPEACDAVFPGKIQQGMICATGSAPDMDSCDGDSGGPMTREGRGTPRPVLVGIVSWGDKQCGARAGVYTRVEDFKSFIAGVLGAQAAGIPQ